MQNWSKVLIAFGAGVAIGSLLGVLFAPGKGSETRKKFSETANGLSDKLKNAMHKGKDSILGLRDELEEIVELTKESA